MKVKELFEANDIWAQILGGLAGKSASQVSREQDARRKYKAMRDAEKQPKKDASKPTEKPEIKVDIEEPKKKTAPEKQGPINNPNENVNTKIEYLKQEGVLQSGRITDDERRYIDSVDVYIDPNKFDREDSSTRFIKSKPPHHMNFQTSVQIPMKDWQKAIGREGAGLTGYVTFDLTPAGWWSNDFKAYINPNNKLDDLVTGFQK